MSSCCCLFGGGDDHPRLSFKILAVRRSSLPIAAYMTNPFSIGSSYMYLVLNGAPSSIRLLQMQEPRRR